MPDAITAQPAAAICRFLTFRLADTLYALPAGIVAEVIHVPAVARVPQSPSSLLGIANLRGAVLPVVDLGALLGHSSDNRSAATKAIVLDTGTSFALAVEQVESLVAIAETEIETREAQLSARSGELLSGTFRVGADGQVAKILDVEALLAEAFARRANPQRRSHGSTAQARDTHKLQVDARDSTTLVTFEVAGQEFALELEAVQEILPAPSVLMAIPRAETLVAGVTSLRNRVLPLLSLRGLLGLPPAPVVDGREKVVVTNVRGAQVGLVADRARAILTAPRSSIDAVPAVLAARTNGEARIKGIYRGDGGRRLVSILFPEQLFREDVMRRLGQDKQNEQDRSVTHDSTQQRELQFLVFRLGADEFGLPIDSVDEVGDVPEKVTRLPKTPKFLEGVTNLRGDVLPIVDQRRRFDMPAGDAAERRRLVVVRTERHRAGLIVDGVKDVLRVTADSVQPPPELTDQIARLVRGVINIEKSQRIVLVLDPSELLTQAERKQLDAFQKVKQANA
jgi:purine-binding chemotaxis protein CheW